MEQVQNIVKIRFISSCIEFVMYTWNQGRSTKAKSVDRALSCILGVAKRDVFWGLPNMYPESYDCGLPVRGAASLFWTGTKN